MKQSFGTSCNIENVARRQRKHWRSSLLYHKRCMVSLTPLRMVNRQNVSKQSKKTTVTYRRLHSFSRKSFLVLIGSLLQYVTIQLANAASKVPWNYQNEAAEGPKNWGSLSEEYKLCADGNLQSPIVLIQSNATVQGRSKSPFSLVTKKAKFFVHKEPLMQDIIYIEQSFPPPSMVGDAPLIDQSGMPSPAATIENTELNVTYVFDHLLFHMPSSEHAIQGIRTDAEMNIVFQNTSKPLRYIYLSVLLRITDNVTTTTRMEPIFELLESFLEDDTTKRNKIDFDLGECIPSLASNDYFSYQGSLVFPPCSENVHWLVFAEPQTMTTQQWNILRQCQPNDNVRPLQATNNRTILLYAEEHFKEEKERSQVGLP